MSSLSETTATAAEVDAYLRGLQPYGLAPLWQVTDTLLPEQPRSRALPYQWRWREARPLVLRAAEVVGTRDAERRVLMLLNPGLHGEAAATTTLYAGIQIVMPGEIARAHRHTASALRFVIEGEGAYTAVDGERVTMREGDLVLTPNWTWHDHGNESGRPIIWLDGLDLPIVNGLEAMFFEPHPEDRQAHDQPVDGSPIRYGAAGLLPAGARPAGGSSPLLNYTWERTWATLQAIAALGERDAADGVLLRYSNPFTGGPVLPTIGCHVQLLEPGRSYQAHRHTSSAVYHVVRGAGATTIDGQRFDWEAKDTFALPAWAWHTHVVSGSKPAVLFSFSDRPVIDALGLYREQAAR